MSVDSGSRHIDWRTKGVPLDRCDASVDYRRCQRNRIQICSVSTVNFLAVFYYCFCETDFGKIRSCVDISASVLLSNDFPFLFSTRLAPFKKITTCHIIKVNSHQTEFVGTKQNEKNRKPRPGKRNLTKLVIRQRKRGGAVRGLSSPCDCFRCLTTSFVGLVFPGLAFVSSRFVPKNSVW